MLKHGDDVVLVIANDKPNRYSSINRFLLVSSTFFLLSTAGLCHHSLSLLLPSGVFSVTEITADLKMGHFSFQQNACEEIRSAVPISESRDHVVCPKPRRVGVLANNPIRPHFRWHMSHQGEVCDMKAGADLLDLILKKEGYGVEQSAGQVASSPPYFCGSPPSRATNPLIQDTRFGEEKLPLASPSAFSSPSSASRGGGCGRMSFGLKPAAVRVEGFDCLNRDRQSSSIPAMA